MATSKQRVLGALDPGDWFRVSIRPGQVFKVHHLHRNGREVVFYGGDKSPEGHNQFGALLAHTRVVPIKNPRAGGRAHK